MDKNMDREEILENIPDLAKKYAELLRSHGAHEPDWDPLEKVLPLKWCGGFMFMGYSGRVRMYKQGFTRRYLNVDPEGNTYFYSGESDFYYKVPKSVAIKHVFGGLRQMGFKRTTALSDAALAKRDKALAEAGWTTVRLDPRTEEGFTVTGPEDVSGANGKPA